MSGPLEQAGVEDVLSSIRRLVSEDNRIARSPSSARAKGLRPRLVLTPALRVSPEDAATPEPAAAEDDFTENTKDVFDSPNMSEHTMEDAQVETAEVFPHEEEDRSEVSPAARFLGGDDTLERPASLDVFSLRGLSTDAGGADADVQLEVEAEVAEDGTLQSPPWKDPDTTLYDAAVGLEDAGGEAETAASAADDVSPRGPSEAPETTAEVTQLHNATARQRAAAVVRKIAEMEAADANSTAKVQWEPDARQNGPFANGTSTWRAPADESVVPETADPVEVLSAEVVDITAEEIEDDIAETVLAADNISDEAAVLDEDTLRDMVVEIVRSELQGALGEKITRNVRKLVRREIQRALAAHDLL